MDKPAIQGGEPVFDDIVPITQPTLPELRILYRNLSEIFSTSVITNSKFVKELETKATKYLDVNHAVAVSNCTSGLMLVLKSLNLSGEVILPSFTFSATGHSLLWNDIKPAFVDCDPETFLIDPNHIEENVTSKTSAILAVHIFGNPCDVNRLQEIADEYGLKLIFDAAHAFGSLYNGKHIGSYGNVEVFSTSPTKLFTTGEGGLVTTSDAELKRKVTIGRNYGDDGSYDCEFAGLSARMSEFHAILGLKTLETLEKNVVRRNELAHIYKDELQKLPGISFQKINPNWRTTYKDLSIIVDEEKFGLNRDDLCIALEKENIMTKRYFYPPLHRQRAYAQWFQKFDAKLPVTKYISEHILSLPLYSHMSEHNIKKICYAIRRIYEHV